MLGHHPPVPSRVATSPGVTRRRIRAVEAVPALPLGSLLAVEVLQDRVMELRGVQVGQAGGRPGQDRVTEHREEVQVFQLAGILHGRAEVHYQLAALEVQGWLELPRLQEARFLLVHHAVVLLGWVGQVAAGPILVLSVPSCPGGKRGTRSCPG